MRIIPKKTKVTIEFFKGIDIINMLIGFIGLSLVALIIMSTVPFKLPIITALIIIFAVLLAPIDEDKNYEVVLYVLRYLAHPRVVDNNKKIPLEQRDESQDKKKHGKKSDGKRVGKNQSQGVNIEDIMAFTGIEGEQIQYGDAYSASVISIAPVEFRFLSERRQDAMIERVFGSALRTITGAGRGASIIKIDRPIIYDATIQSEFGKMEELKEAFLNSIINEEELSTRVEIIYDRIMEIESINLDEKVYDSFHYLVICDKNKQSLRELTHSVYQTLDSGGLPVTVLGEKELAVFLKYNITRDFNEREIDQIKPEDYKTWIMPKRMEFGPRMIKIDDIITYNLKIVNYPTEVSNAWGHSIFNMENTKVVMKLTPVDRFKAVRNIDRSLDELRGQESNTSKESRLIELAGHINTLQNLLLMLQSDNEQLFNVSIYITLYDYEESERQQLMKENPKGTVIPPSDMRRRIKRNLSEQSFRTSDMFLRQFEVFVGGQVSRYDPFLKKARGIHSNSVAAVFPFVYSHLHDLAGFHIGNSSGLPVFIDFFVRDRNRINSNMVVIGKSGGGKSYATKMMLTNLAAENSKIYILDPENEYTELAKNLHGNWIDVGSATQGRINPFHIITALNDDDTQQEEENVSYAVHLQFLEEYLKQILPGIDADSMEFLNNIIIRVYDEKGIDASTNLGQLSPEDFPIFDDLYDKLLTDYQASDSDYTKNHLRTLINYISKFATGGRNSHLWNGPSSLDVKENFTVFNFQSLLANKNNTVANAQMLLILKWLDNEIIKNRDYNTKYHAKRKIIVVIDEAHVFIDEKFPIALDFMFQLAKRIRKYNGMQIVITQNVKDFVGTEDLARKSTAIINASQYSFIFPMAPNDMHDLCKLYEKAGGINEVEQDEIVNNGRGHAFVVTTPSDRSSIEITAANGIAEMFE
ncbi:MAG: ATP-binding protein [Clostridium sp.]